MYNAKALGKNQISGYPRPPRLAVAPTPIPGGPVDDGEPGMAGGEPTSEPMAAGPALPPLAPPAAAAEPAAAADAVSDAEAVSQTEPMPVEEPVAAAASAPEHGRVAVEVGHGGAQTEGEWTSVPPRIGLAIAENHPDEEEPDAAEVRRQIAAARRSFDPDYQIRRAMDAFLSPPDERRERRPD
jgi:hypothetical protein